MDLFNDPDLNLVLAMAEMFPMTTSKEECPALGIAVDWDQNGKIYAVAEVPISFSCPN